MSTVIGVIPARYASSRFPGKPLVEIGGVSMIRRVYENAKSVAELSQVVVATDDERIFQHVRQFGGQVVMTRAEHPSGTDRCAEVAGKPIGAAADIVVNIQGDEPFLDGRQLRQLIQPFTDPAVEITTLGYPIREEENLHSPNVVKVVTAGNGRALYFSRCPIPYIRAAEPAGWLTQGLHLQHLGLYAYRRSTLLALADLPPGRLEQAESLEQLRWLEAGYTIHVGITDIRTLGIDTPEDLGKAEAWLRGH